MNLWVQVRRMKISRSAQAVFLSSLAILTGAWASWLLMPQGAARLSLVTTVRLGSEVTLLCLLLGVAPLYAAYRQPKWPALRRMLLFIAMGSLLIPTIARSLALSSLFAYYGPIATAARAISVWPEGEPLDSSHLAVVISLLTLYLPFVLLVVSECMEALGRIPDIAATLGANSIQTGVRVVVPRLLRPMATAGLIVFSQVLGVIITPRILDSREVTLAVLIDDLLKRTMDTAAAMRVGFAEVVLALPVAAVAAYFVEGELRARGRPLMTALRFRGGRILALIPIGILLLVPTVLLALSLGSTPILDPTAVFRNGPSVHWYRVALRSATFWSVSASSLCVWTTATLLSVLPAIFFSVLLLPFSQLRRIGRWIALLLLFIPQNALGVLLFVATSSFPQIQASFPGWLFGGIGQAVPGFAFCFLLMDRVAEQQARSLRIAATLGASFIQRFMRIALPRFLPAIGISITATALISLDDIIFVRYLPRIPVATFATQLFDQARYGASPDIAAFCILIAAVVGLLLSGGMLLESIPRLRRALVGRFLGHANAGASQLTH